MFYGITIPSILLQRVPSGITACVNSAETGLSRLVLKRFRTMHMAPVDTTKRLQALRERLADPTKPGGPLQAFYIPAKDAHYSEYLPECYKRPQYMSGFTGTAASVVVTQKEAALWTDGRYFLQAEQQLDHNWTLMKVGQPKVPAEEEWLLKVLPPNSRVGVDPFLTPYDRYSSISNLLANNGHTLVPVEPNPVDDVWVDRPPLPTSKAFAQPLKYAGRSMTEKLAAVRAKIGEVGADLLVLTNLDEVVWFFNIRGSDITFNPVLYGYAIVSPTDVFLFMDDYKLADLDSKWLEGVTVRPYDAIQSELAKLAQHAKRVWVSQQCSHAIAKEIPSDRLYAAYTPACTLKATKNAAELEGARQAQIRDGAALCLFLHWLEQQVKAGAHVTEWTAAVELERFRSQQQHFISLSFKTTSAMGPNGAIIHYKPDPETCPPITDQSLYLVDSGAHYRDGTTDTTRTVHMGTPTDYQRKCYTLVLKGHINVAQAVFPPGTGGHKLDVIARLPLWSQGLDFGHGTGHGVGSFLNVHEGPQRIGMGCGPPAMPDYPLEAGMLVSDEPGYYEEGNFGIRIENVIAVVPANTPHKYRNNTFFTFDTLTMAPYAPNLIDTSLLDDREIAWVDNYHRRVVEVIGPMVKEQGGEAAYDWLMWQTRPLGR
eukprot:comp5890_c0_seq2/m.1748 comp5890_c0_seq2/g.1748  ORF comp5890_c0_seq2/g.1748 comp5890_c0_seq2/m.1748 type:complete len:655 (-) comp5890_c0_seq2:260-2224(-)